MKLRTHPQKRRTSAYYPHRENSALAAHAPACNGQTSARRPQTLVRVVYHFRTPSPNGRYLPSGKVSPIFFRIFPGAWREVAENSVTSCFRAAEPFDVILGSYPNGNIKGGKQCLSNRGLSQQQQPWASPPVAKQRAIRRWQVAQSGRGLRFLSTEALLKAPQSAPPATSSSANLTPAAAGDAKKSRWLASGQFASVPRPFRVYCPQWADIARNRGRYYETSDQHGRSRSAPLRSGLHQSSGCVQQGQRVPPEPPYQQLKTSSVRLQVRDIARPVLPRQGGFLRSTIHFERDSTCSTRS